MDSFSENYKYWNFSKYAWTLSWISHEEVKYWEPLLADQTKIHIVAFVCLFYKSEFDFFSGMTSNQNKRISFFCAYVCVYMGTPTYKNSSHNTWFIIKKNPPMGK